MSKTSSSSLTGSRKKRGVLGADQRDELDGRLRLIETLAHLLGAGGEAVLLPEMVSNAGMFIGDEVRRVKALLEDV